MARVEPVAAIGVFGGSGFYELLTDVESVELETPFGLPSAPIAIGEVGGTKVAFLPRHGQDHTIPPHAINFRANVWALRELGVHRIIGPSAVGSLQPHLHPGEMVVLDQLVDRTSGRRQTFFDGPDVRHTSFADPYCPELRAVLLQAGSASGVTVHDGGTVVVVDGPRFSTRAESRWFRAAGWHVVNMTQHPEAFLARELGLCYAGLALITDYDAGLEGVDGIESVTMEAVLAVLAANADRTREVVLRAVPAIAPARACGCAGG